jgi:hypothetical protein
MALGMVEQAQLSTVGKAGKGMKRGLRGRSMIRRFGLILALGLLAIGLLAVPLGASAAPASATGAEAVTSSVAYYDPTIYVPYSVASGDPIYIEGYGFDSYDSVVVAFYDLYGNWIASGTAYTDWDGYFSGRLHVPAVEPGYYSIVVVDGYGTTISTVIEITYD